jgi:hypothetical protein
MSFESISMQAGEEGRVEGYVDGESQGIEWIAMKEEGGIEGWGERTNMGVV